MTTLQQRRHQDIIAQLAKENERRDDWIVKLGRSDAKLRSLRRAIARSSKRLDTMRANAPQQIAPPAPKAEAPAYVHGASLASKIDDVLHDDPIPVFLDRRNLMADPKTNDKKAERKAVEKEKLDAKLTGKLKKMPLTGKAALDAIRAG